MLNKYFTLLIIALATPVLALGIPVSFSLQLLNQRDSFNAVAQGIENCIWVTNKPVQTCFPWPQPDNLTPSSISRKSTLSSSGVTSSGTTYRLSGSLSRTATLTSQLQTPALSTPSIPASSPHPAPSSPCASPPTSPLFPTRHSRSIITKTITTTVTYEVVHDKLFSILSTLPSHQSTTVLSSTADNGTYAPVETCIWVSDKTMQTCFPWPQRSGQRRVVDAAKNPGVWRGQESTFVTRVRARTVVG